MSKQLIYDQEGHAHYVTFTCYKHRRLLDNQRAKRIVIAILNDQLKKQDGKCAGFVIMPDHVHVIVWFKETNQLSHFMKQWKQRSSVQIKKNLKNHFKKYQSMFDTGEPIWQRRYFSFNLYSPGKIREKIDYMHDNPVKAGLVSYPEEWEYSSARYITQGKSVGVKIEFPG